MPLTEEYFENRTDAARAAATRVAQALARDLSRQSEALLVVSGGGTPKDCYALLANTNLAWSNVRIFMSDERCVAASHADSNEGMIRRSLLIEHASRAQLVPIYKEGRSPGEQCRMLTAVIDTLLLPFSISLLGMGEDGHFASLFPDFDRLAEGLDAESENRCLPVQTAASPHSRVTLTMPTFLQSREILLLFFGQAKRVIFEHAKNPASDYPLGRLLQQGQTPVHTIWAP